MSSDTLLVPILEELVLVTANTIHVAGSLTRWILQFNKMVSAIGKKSEDVKTYSNLIMVPCCHLLPARPAVFFPLPNVQPVGEKATIKLNRS